MVNAYFHNNEIGYMSISRPPTDSGGALHVSRLFSSHDDTKSQEYGYRQ